MQRWIFGLCAMLTAFSSTAMAVTLGHAMIVHPLFGLRDVVYEQQDRFAVVEGDILIADYTGKLVASSSLPRALILFKLGGDRWPQGIVPFMIADNLPLVNKLAVLDAMALWQRSAHVQFVEVTLKNYRQYKDYIVFSPTTGTTCSSYVGKQNGPQPIVLPPRCQSMNIAHEIGHALGLWHEQSRGDRDQYIKILWENIEPDYQYNFNQHLTDGRDFGDYDYQSIMHYSAYAFSKNGLKTIVPRHDLVEIGQRDHLSTKDIAAVNAMYQQHDGQDNSEESAVTGSMTRAGGVFD
jgi:hypothetical protein